MTTQPTPQPRFVFPPWTNVLPPLSLVAAVGGLCTVIFGICLAYSGSVLYAWRKWSDHRKSRRRGVPYSLHVKLTAAMMLVMLLDCGGYLLAVRGAQDNGAVAVVVI